MRTPAFRRTSRTVFAWQPELLANLGQGLTSDVELSGLIDLGEREATITPSDALTLEER
jgi:hypothetical protein